MSAAPVPEVQAPVQQLREKWQLMLDHISFWVFFLKYFRCSLVNRSGSRQKQGFLNQVGSVLYFRRHFYMTSVAPGIYEDCKMKDLQGLLSGRGEYIFCNLITLLMSVVCSACKMIQTGQTLQNRIQMHVQHTNFKQNECHCLKSRLPKRTSSNKMSIWKVFPLELCTYECLTLLCSRWTIVETHLSQS